MHEVDPGHHLGDRMLDLQPRVHLQEVEPALVVQQEFERARVGVADGAAQGDRGVRQRLPDRRGHRGRRRLLDHLLVPPLDRAFALDERDHRAVLVAQHLDLDVARTLDEPFEVDRRLAEGGPRLGPRALDPRRDPLGAGDAAHPPSAAAGHRLDEQRITHLVGPRPQLGLRQGVGQRPGAGHHRHPGVDGRLPGRRLPPHRFDDAGVRPDEHQPRVAAGAGERRVLGEEPVARMHCRCPRPGRRVQHPLDVQIALGGGARPDGRRLVGVTDVERRPIALGVHGDRRDPHLAARPQDAHGDLASVGDQNLHVTVRCGATRPPPGPTGDRRGATGRCSRSLRSVANPLQNARGVGQSIAVRTQPSRNVRGIDAQPCGVLAAFALRAGAEGVRRRPSSP